MRSYIQITGKYLRAQKRRSILTVVGIVLSVALITGVGTIFLGMYDANMRGTIQSYGDFYAAVPNVPATAAPVLAGNVEVSKAGFSQNLGYAAYAKNPPSDYDTPYKYLSLSALDSNALTMLPGCKLDQGRLPAAPGEIALDGWTLKYMPGVKIGDTVSLDIGTRTLPDGTQPSADSTGDPKEVFTKTETRKFTIVGTLKPQYILTLNMAKAVTWMDGNSLPAGEQVSVCLKLKSVANAVDRIKSMADSAGLKTAKGEANAIQYNERVLRLYAQSVSSVLNGTIITTIAVILALVVLATIAVIYNAFNISVVERVAQFGLMRCVGATPRQISSVVFREAFILGVIGIPVGVACGLAAMAVVFSVIAAIAPGMLWGGGTVRLVISPWLIIGSALLGALTIYLSALLPARKAARISPMEAVRGAVMLKKEKYKTGDRKRIVLKVMGVEGWMAWKNLGRNRRRFYITVMSMVISIMLYIVFSSLMGYAYQSGAVDTGGQPSYVINPKNGRDSLDQDGLAGIAGMDGIEYMLQYSAADAVVTIPADRLNSRAKELLASSGLPEIDENGNAVLRGSGLVCYKDDEIDALLKTLKLGSVDAEAFRRGDGIIVINGGSFYDTAARKSVLADVTSIKPGDTVNVKTVEYREGGDKETVKNLPVLAVTGEGMPQYKRNQNGGVYMIVSEKLFHEMAPGEQFPRAALIMMKPNSDHTAVKDRVYAYMDRHPDYNLVDADELAKNFSQTMIPMSIFLYGFVAVISLIGCLNIINTVSTNIIVRTRELSVLRAIGMSERGMRKMVALESVLHAAAAALVGVAAGTALSWVVYSLLIRVREFPWSFPWQQALIAVAAAAVVAVVSGAVPLKRISKGVIMEGIRGEE